MSKNVEVERDYQRKNRKKVQALCRVKAIHPPNRKEKASRIVEEAMMTVRESDSNVNQPNFKNEVRATNKYKTKGYHHTKKQCSLM